MNERLIKAITSNDVQKVKRALNSEIKIFEYDENGDTYLHVAIKHCTNVKILHYLILRGISVNFQNQKKESPLKYACKYKKFDFVMFLLFVFADPNQQDEQGNTPLHVICEAINSYENYTYREKDTIKNIISALLIFSAKLDTKNNVGKKPIEYLENSSYLKDTLAIWKQLENTNPTIAYKFHLACKFGALLILEQMHDFYNINAIDTTIDGQTLIQVAVDSDQLLIQRYLLKICPTFNSMKFVKIDETCSSIWNKINLKKDPLLSLMRYAKQDLDAMEKQDNYGNSILHYAIWRRPRFATYLFRQGVNIYITNKNEETPVHIAIKHNDYLFIGEALLSQATDFIVQSREILVYASIYSKLQMIILLLEYFRHHPSAITESVITEMIQQAERFNTDDIVEHLENNKTRYLQTPS